MLFHRKQTQELYRFYCLVMVIFDDYVAPPPKVIPQFHLQSRVKRNHKSPPMISPFPRAQLVLVSTEVTGKVLPTHTLLCKLTALQCKFTSNN